jgi:hypothetical protein
MVHCSATEQAVHGVTIGDLLRKPVNEFAQEE